MSELNFDELANTNPESLSRRLRQDYVANDFDALRLGIDPTATFETEVRLHRIKHIGAKSVIHSGTTLEAGVHVGSNVTIEGPAYFCKGVRIGSSAEINTGGYFAEGAQLLGEYTSRSHEYKRVMRGNVTVGPGVQLPSEVQLGKAAVVPTTDSIGQIGRFGKYHRMVTAYGSQSGPLYGVGCQFGIDIETFKQRVKVSSGTSPDSAGDYHKHMPEIEVLGMQVQAAYDREGNLIEELVEARREVITPLFSPLKPITINYQ